MKTRGRIQEPVGNGMTGMGSILGGSRGRQCMKSHGFFAYSSKPVNRYSLKTVKPYYGIDECDGDRQPRL